MALYPAEQAMCIFANRVDKLKLNKCDQSVILGPFGSKPNIMSCLYSFLQKFLKMLSTKVVESLTLYDEVDIINLFWHRNVCVNSMFEKLAYFNDYRGYFQKTRTSFF